MGWTIILEDENKGLIESLDNEFISDVIFDSSNNNKFNLIKYLDPYGDTVFNYLQMDDLILDFKKLQGIRYDESIEEIIKLASKCKSEPHKYLVFYGD